jgi:hypothetical protein
MGAGGHTDNTDADGTDNVIRFPRDWFGSTDDLVPFGPAADRLAAAAAGREQRHEDELADALTANDFWGEGAGALHQPVGVPDVEEPGAPESATPALGRFEADPARHRLAAVEPVDGWRRFGSALPTRGWLSGVAVAVMLTCGVGIFLLSHTHSGPTATRAAAVTHPVSVAPSENLSRQVDLLAARGVREAARAVAVVERLPMRAPRRRGRAKPRRRARHTGATRHTRVATASPISTEPVSTSPPTSVADTSGSVAVTAESSAAVESSSAAARSSDTRASAEKSSSTRTGSSSGTSTPPASKSTKPTASQPSKPAASRSSKSSSASSTLAPGPTTAGSAGSNCDPQCQ